MVDLNGHPSWKRRIQPKNVYIISGLSSTWRDYDLSTVPSNGQGPPAVCVNLAARSSPSLKRDARNIRVGGYAISVVRPHAVRNLLSLLYTGVGIVRRSGAEFRDALPGATSVA